MASKTGKNLRTEDKLERYAFRSTRQVVFHVLASMVAALVLYVLLQDKLSVPETYFVIITSSISAASGALLAVTIALSTFYGLHVTNWRDKLVDKLTEASARMRKQMEKSVRQYPEISRKLAPIYEKSLLYVPGMPIDKKKIDETARSFLDWAKEQNKSQEIDAGDVAAYDSFEIHLKDALLCEHEVHHSLTLLSVVRRHVQTLETFPHLVIGWLTVLILTLTFAIAGGMGVLPEEAGFPLLIIPFWLFLVGGFALVKDIVAVFGVLRIQEVGFDIAWAEVDFENNGERQQRLKTEDEAEQKSLGEIDICQATWAMENTLLQAYRAVCAAMEAFLLGTGMGMLNSSGKTGPFWIVFAGGIAVAFFWMVVCIRRADIANMWSREVIARAKGRITIEDKKTKQILKAKRISIDSPYEYEDTKPSLWLSGFLNWGIPLMLIILWVFATVRIHPN